MRRLSHEVGACGEKCWMVLWVLIFGDVLGRDIGRWNIGKQRGVDQDNRTSAGVLTAAEGFDHPSKASFSFSRL